MRGATRYVWSAPLPAQQPGFFARARVGCLLVLVLAAGSGSLPAQDDALQTGKSEASASTWNPQFHPTVHEDEFLRQGAAFAKMLDGRIVRYSAKTISISEDNGETWSEARPVPIGEHTGSAAKLAVTPGGVLVLAYMNSAESVWEWESDTKKLGADSTLPVYALRSTDEGATWTEPQRIFAGRSGALTDILAHSSGSVVLPITGFRREPARLVLFVMVTRDDGLTWTERVIDIGGHGHHEGAMEPTLVELQDGRIWMLIRTNHDVLYESFSEDGGLTWSEAAPTAIDASSSPPYLRRLASGRLLLVWNRVRPDGVTEAEWKSRPLARRGGDFGEIAASWHREEFSIAFSEDDGRSWSDPVVIARQPNGWLSYPRLFEPTPGEIKLGLYFNYEIVPGPKAEPRGAIFLGFREDDFLSTAVSQASDSSSARLLFKGDFEDGSLKRYGDMEGEQTAARTRFVTSPVRAGKQALELRLDRNPKPNHGNHRTDFWIKGMSNRFPLSEEYWFGFSSFFPASWQPDTQAELFAQWIGEGLSSPPLGIYVYGENYRIKKRWASEAEDYRNLWSGPVAGDLGQWTDWVFRVRWSRGKEGEIEVWKNGEKIVSDTGPNGGDERFAPYFKFGLYKWSWQRSPDEAPSTVTKRTLVFDEIRIAAGAEGRALVEPNVIAE